MDNGRGVCTFMWRIENYSYCWHPNGFGLNSPVFNAKDMEGTAWNLRLYPRGETDRCTDHISLFLFRSDEDEGPEELTLKYELSFLAADGWTLVCKNGDRTFKKGHGYGYEKFQERKEVLLSKKTDYLPQDTLSVCCEIREMEGDEEPETRIYFRTRIGVEHISCRIVIENFSALESNERKIVYLNTPTKNRKGISCELYLPACCPQKIRAEIKTSDTAWNLRLFPRGYKNECTDHISLYLGRSAEDEGPEEFRLKYELSFLAADGSTLVCKNGDCTFKKGDGYGYEKFQEMKVLLSKKTDYLPQDTLSVCCKIPGKEGNEQPETRIYFRSRIGVEDISCRIVIENFSALESNERKIVYLNTPTKNQKRISCELYLSACSCCPQKIMAEIKTFDIKCRLSKLKICLLDVSGKEVGCGEVDNRMDFTGKENRILPLSLTRRDILNKKSEYLPDDKLTLSCECSFSTGVEYEKIERAVFEIPLVASRKHDVDDAVVNTVDSGRHDEFVPKQSTEKFSMLKCLFVAVFACFFGFFFLIL